MNQLREKVCIITGGAGSIGRKTARLFIEEGARVLLVDVNEDDLRVATRDLDPERVAVAVADVSRASDTEAYCARAVSIFGNIDVLLSNAGNAGVIAPLQEYPDEVFDSVYAVHVKGAYLACKHGLSKMNDGSSIIITSSVAAFRGD